MFYVLLNELNAQSMSVILYVMLYLNGEKVAVFEICPVIRATGYVQLAPYIDIGLGAYH